MATVPTPAEVERAILDGAKKYVQRPNTIFPYVQVGADLQEQGFTADELNAAYDRMVERGWLATTQSQVHLLVTDAGFAEL